MASPAFGFSVGDFIAGTRLLVQIIDAFKNADGASSKYAAQVSFLHSFKATLEHLARHIQKTPQCELSEDIASLLGDISVPWAAFKTFLAKHERALGQIANKSGTDKLRRIPRVVQFTMNEISGKVDKLRTEIQQPLAAVNSLLLLQVIASLDKISEKKLRPEQCAQLVEAIRLADIPAELDKQIGVLKRTADEHNVKQDEQLEVITTLRNQLSDLTSTLQGALDSMRRDRKSTKQRDIQQDIGRLTTLLTTRTATLESAMKDQEDMIQELKSFVEDKSTGAQESQTPTSSWPSATVSSAYFAALLLSTIVSTCTATSVLTRTPRNSAQSPVFLPKDYALPGLRAINQSKTQQVARDNAADNRGGEDEDSQETARQWVSHFSSQSHTTTQGTVQGRGLDGGISVGEGRGPDRMSKLDAPGNDKSGDHHGGQDGDDGDYGDGLLLQPGPVWEDPNLGDEDGSVREDDSGDDTGSIWEESGSNSDSSDSGSVGGGGGCSDSGGWHSD
ncbi:hypothetical protein BDW62DRAFT_206789 [Aspergillus aurantiobrunneus]